jgi:ketosteroid isomerase-like protein
MVSNDADAIGEHIADEWTIIGPDGSVGDKWWFLDLIRSGRLSHDTMDTHDPVVRVYGDAALLIAHGVSAGVFEGQPFRFDERVSCVFIRRDGSWRCVSTHLSQIAPE